MECYQIGECANTAEALKEDIARHVRYTLGKDQRDITRKDLYLALAHAVRDRIVDRLLTTRKRQERAGAKRLYYLSMEFLMGQSLGNNLVNMGLMDVCQEVLREFGADLEEIMACEEDAALGNGGLGRLAACFLDSMASMDLPGFGYGINYEYGLFRQAIDNGFQKERPDNWQADGTPWQIERPDEKCIVPVYGRVIHAQDRHGHYNPMWMEWEMLVGIPFDMPIVGYGGRTVNSLRLYSARSSSEFDMKIFNEGDYFKAVEHNIESEKVSKVLYPADSFEAGQELRLVQEYFFVSCALQDMVRQYRKTGERDFDNFPSRVAIQLNDTHPALAVAELMRILVDQYAVHWERAWNICRATLAYTNHTLLPEALEKWPVELMERVLPRHLQIIFEINQRFLQQVEARFPADTKLLRDVSIIEEGERKQVRMANLAVTGSHSVNGVAALHTKLLKRNLLSAFHRLQPELINNKTNGITQRRWLLSCNPGLANLITDAIGDHWITDLDRMRDLEPYAEDEDFLNRFLAIKKNNKERLAGIIEQTAHVRVDPDTLFDVQVKRIHEYKRQLLNVMHIVHLYLAFLDGEIELPEPRTFIFAGKAAPGYFVAKMIIKLINNVARVINNDPRLDGVMKVVFLPDYRVSLAERIIPAADLSEQISTAGKEASGTGNMKFALNGALTIGTLDGANIEIMQEVGEENIFIFGLSADEVQELRQNGSYDSWDFYNSNQNIKRVMDSLVSDTFCPEEPGLFTHLFNSIMHHGDEYFHLADLEAYIRTQDEVSREFGNRLQWGRKALLNVARMGRFSSDRTIGEYAGEIWGIRKV
jgi:starch phosphorylase